MCYIVFVEKSLLSEKGAIYEKRDPIEVCLRVLPVCNFR